MRTKQCPKRVLHEQNCDTRLRFSFFSYSNDIISMAGTHGFDYTIYHESEDGIKVTRFSNREDAYKEFKRLEKIYKARK